MGESGEYTSELTRLRRIDRLARGGGADRCNLEKGKEHI